MQAAFAVRAAIVALSFLAAVGLITFVLAGDFGFDWLDGSEEQAGIATVRGPGPAEVVLDNSTGPDQPTGARAAVPSDPSTGAAGGADSDLFSFVSPPDAGPDDELYGRPTRQGRELLNP